MYIDTNGNNRMVDGREAFDMDEGGGIGHGVAGLAWGRRSTTCRAATSR